MHFLDDSTTRRLDGLNRLDRTDRLLILTLLTDFGTRDYFIGAMKGAILSVNPNAQIIDLTHDVPPQDVRSAAFTLFAACQTFPAQAIHVSVVDPGVGSNRRAIIAVADKHIFVAPDNGILSFVYAQSKHLQVFEITNSAFFRERVSATFHGRDVFAPVAGALSLGIAPDELGTEIFDFVRLEIARPQLTNENTIAAEILHVDRFGNCVTNVTRDDLPQAFWSKSSRVLINDREITEHFDFYAQAAEGEIFTIFGSADFLEIVAFKDSAANLLKIKSGQALEIKF